MALVKGTNCGFVTASPSADPSGDSNVAMDFTGHALKDTAPVGATTITEIGWWCNEATEEANFEVAIYGHNVGDDNPEAIIGSDTTNAKGTTAGWKKVTGLSIPITAGTIYWIAAQLDETLTNTQTDYTADAGELNDIHDEITTLPDPWGEGSGGQVAWKTAIYAVWETYPYFVAAGSIVSDSGGDTTPTPPTHIENDILIAVSENFDGNAMSTGTAGWTEIADSNGHAFYWKRAPGSGTAGPQIIGAGGGWQFSICYVIRGAITTVTPFEDATITETQDNTPTTSEIDTTSDNRFAICFASISDDTAWSSGPPPATWTTEDDQTTADLSDARFTVIAKEVPSSTTVSQVNVGTLGASEYWGSTTMAFIPPAAATGTNFQINIGDAWKDVDAIQVNIGDTWKTAAGAQVNIGDTWKSIF